MTARSKEGIDGDFFASVMPKEEIGAVRFLKDHPDYDGRDVIIAVFDTGVDPGSKGLQITTDGRPKLMDVLDCTGSGDVDTSEIVKMDENGRIKGVNGKLMKVNPKWTNPSGDWHVGVRSAYELFPAGFKRILQTKRLNKFHLFQREVVTKANKELAEFKSAHPNCIGEDEQKTKAELESRVQLLQSMMSNYKDPGPLIDCVVWYDGENWRAALDTSDFYEEDEEKGKLADFIPLTNFWIEHGYGTFSEHDGGNFVCNIYEDGNLLSIVVDAGTHATHVAGIAAAYHPESPEFNGVAPGARLISCKIGDTRLGSMETGVGIVRAAIAAIHWKVDIINLSFGECYAMPNSGRVLNTINDLVYKHGIIFMSSAGNGGPALSTVGGPSCCDGCISIGAYVSPAMAASAHSVREELANGKQYTFTSRGPTLNSMAGVELCAPGGAMSDVPQWTGRSRTFANGTSMASPDASGGLALLLSGLKQKGGSITPNRLRRAMENTASLPDFNDSAAPPTLTYGRGLLQVDKAWKYLEKTGDVDTPDLRFNVIAQRKDDAESSLNFLLKPSVPRADRRCFGIYIREPQDVCKLHTFFCEVTPVLPKDDDLEEKLEVEIKFSLERTSDWVKCPDALLLVNAGRTFEVEVDAGRAPDAVNYAEVQGFDSTAKWRGPLFRLPITVINPISTSSSEFDIDLGTHDFGAGVEVRRFVPVPVGASWAELILTAGEHDGTRSFYTGMKTLLPDVRTDEFSYSPDLRFKTGQHFRLSFPVVEGRMLEICLGQNWLSLGECRISMQLELHGISVLQGSHLMLDGSAGNLKIQVMAPLRSEKIEPRVSLKSVLIPLRPTQSTLVPLSSQRDTLPRAHVIHKLTLTYKLKLQEGGKITPRLPMFNRQVYDCEMEAQMVQVFDSNKKLLLVSDIYPASVTVKKGEYTIIAMTRHDNTTVLKRFEHLPLIVEKDLDKDIVMPVYKTHLESTSGGNKIKSTTLYAGQVSTIVIGPLTDALPKDCAPGLIMTGSLSIGQCNQASGAAPTRSSFSYIVPPNQISNDASNSVPEDLPTPAKLSNAARDAKIKVLEGLSLKKEKDLEEFETAFEQLKSDYPGHLPLLTTALKMYDGLDEPQRSELADTILSLCEEIISCIDKIELACLRARACPDESQQGKKRSKEAAEETAALVLALEKQLTTTLKQQEAHGSVDYEVLRPTFEELRKWADPKEPLLALMHAKLEASCGRHAEAIKLLDVVINSDKALAPRDIYDFKVECASALGWHHWARNEKMHIDINFPKRYSLF